MSWVYSQWLLPICSPRWSRVRSVVTACRHVRRENDDKIDADILRVFGELGGLCGVLMMAARDQRHTNKTGYFPYTPATNLLYGLREGIAMLEEEGLDNVFARHARLAEATRRAVKAWGLENLNKNASQYSPTITAVMLPEGHDADKFRALALENFNISYGASFGACAITVESTFTTR